MTTNGLSSFRISTASNLTGAAAAHALNLRTAEMGTLLLPQDLHINEPNEADNVDTDEDDTGVPEPLTASQKRRTQRAIFESWSTGKVARISKEQLKEAIKITDVDAASVQDILAQQESNLIVNDPREYQLELFERAKTQNTIAVLDTGSGKTLIAVLLLKYVIDQELEDREAGKEPRISFFLVCTPDQGIVWRTLIGMQVTSVTLVFQQSAVLECNLDARVARFCGAMGTDLWAKETWDKHFKENQVIVCTAEVLLQCLMHSFISISRINLLVFDEAHHAKKNHAYAREVRSILDPRHSCTNFGAVE